MRASVCACACACVHVRACVYVRVHVVCACPFAGARVCLWHVCINIPAEHRTRFLNGKNRQNSFEAERRV